MDEHEAKFEVTEDFDLSELEPSLASLGLEVGPSKARTIVDVYHDTDDLRLLRWGCTLRHRRRTGWTVKLPVTSRAGRLVRNEVDLGGRSGRVPPQARRLVASFTRGQALGVVATITTERTARLIRSADGGPLAELTDDRTSAETGPGRDDIAEDGQTSTFRQVELELAEGADPGALGPIIDAVIAAGGRPQTDGIKLRLALGLTSLEPDVLVPDLPADPTAHDVIHRAIARSVRQLILQLPVAVLGTDERGVHQARVATRRLRSDLRTFKPMVDRAWAAELSEGVAALAKALGQVRDADVLAPLLRSALADRTDITADAGDKILAHLATCRSQALEELGNHLDRPETVALLDQLVMAAASPATNEQSQEPAKAVLAKPVDRRWQKLSRAVGGLGPNPKPEKLHDVRLLAKRTRYATKAVAPGFGPKTAQFAKNLAALQDTLGDLNDLSTAVHWLDANAADLDPESAYLAGRLAQQLADAQPQGTDWRSDWRAITKSRPGWLRRRS